MPSEPGVRHSSRTPFLPAAPSLLLLSRYLKDFRRNGWSRVVKRCCESIIKAEQWLQRAHSSRSLTVRQVQCLSVSCSRSRLVQGSSWDFSLGSLPPWLLNPPSTHTASRQKAVPEPLLTPLEKESHHTWSSSGNPLHIPRGFGSSIVWLLKHLCHGCIVLPVVRWYVP